MVKIAARAADAFCRAPDPALRLVLVYGPDSGLVRERAQVVVGAVVEDPADPFRMSELSAGDLAAAPHRLADEAAALSFGGGRRVVRVREAGDGIAAAVEAWIGGAPGEALVVIEAGELGPRSRLRRSAEAGEAAAAVPCYRDEGAGLDEVLRQALGREGIGMTPDARAFLVAHLGADRLVTRGEIEKLALYLGPGATADLEAVAASVGDSAELTVEDAVMAAAEGDFAALDRALEQAYRQGVSAIAALRATARHFDRLLVLRARVDQGEAPGRAIAGLRPPVFFKHRGRLERQLSAWRRSSVVAVLDRVVEAELSCKSTGAPARALGRRLLLEVAGAARRGARRPA